MSSEESSALTGALQLTELGPLVAAVAENAFTGLDSILKGEDAIAGDEQRCRPTPCLPHDIDKLLPCML